jgi:hypothetical protein
VLDTGEQLRFPGMDSLDLVDPPRVVGAGPGLARHPALPDFEPGVIKAERGELSPWQKLQLDREYVHLDQTVAGNQIKRATAVAELETERWERLDRRVVRYAILAFILLVTVAAIVLAFLTAGSDPAQARISPGVPVALVGVLGGLGFRALRRLFSV